VDKLSAFYEFGRRLKAFISAGSPAEEIFNRLALDLFALQRIHNPVYRKYCESLTFVSPAHWREIPFLSVAAFKDFEVSVLPERERPVVFKSSGTTQLNRSKHFHNRDSLEIYKASLLPWFRQHVLPDAPNELQIISLSPAPLDAPESSLVHMFDVVARHFAPNVQPKYFASTQSDGAWTLDLDSIIPVLKEASSRNDPVLLLGTAFSFVHLLDGIEDLRLPPKSRVMETGGYKGRSRVIPKEELHALIATKLGIAPNHIVTEYGMSELSSQAYDSTCGAWSDKARIFHFPPWARARIISPETGNEISDGETGLLQILDLANVYSVAALQTEDLALKIGSGFQLLGRIEKAEARGCSLMPAA